MAQLGSAKTSKFAIGTAELRIGPLTSAGLLTQAHSVGLIDSASLNVTQNVVDLKGGFPQVIMDTAVTEQSAEITATLREFSRRNLGILLGQGLLYASNTDGATDAKTTLSASATASATSLSLTAGAGFAANDWIVVYSENDPGSSVVTKIASISSNTVTLDSGLALPAAAASGAIVAKLAPIAVGAVTTVNYFAVQLVTLDRATGRPRVSNFWKAAVGSGMNLANNATDFASTELTLKLLQPSLADYGTSGSELYHLRNVIPTNPIGMMGEASDAAA